MKAFPWQGLDLLVKHNKNGYKEYSEKHKKKSYTRN